MTEQPDTATVSHDRGKLWRNTLLGFGLTALIGWYLWGSHGDDVRRAAAWRALLGNDGFWWFMAVAGLAALALSIAYLRLLFSGRAAVQADPGGITLRSLFGDRHYAWNDVADLNLQTVTAAGRDHYFLKIIGRGRRDASLSANTVEGGEGALEWWIGQATEIARSRTR